MAVTYIPSQLEAPAMAALMLRASPSKLLLDDFKLVLSLLRWIPYLFSPLRSQHRISYAESSLTHGNLKDISLHAAVLALTLTALLGGARIALIFPGWVSLVFLTLCWLILMALCRPLNYGPRVLHSSVDLSMYPQHPGERWLFVNGICAGSRLLQQNLDLLSTLFQRPVVGVHNRTYGMIFDLLECLVQRDFSYMTADIRVVYNKLKETLLDGGVERVVLIAHSQGGIIVAAAVDALCADLPPAAFEKLEIYTFGCAANHFNNPPRSSSRKRQIPVIEHYANQHDFVARLGLLHFIRRPDKNEFVGKVFVRMESGGHLFCQHYLDPMFGEDEGFLEEVVEVEETGREVVGEEEPLLGVVATGGEQPRTVRDLSRFWRYKHGGVPLKAA